MGDYSINIAIIIYIFILIFNVFYKSYINDFGHIMQFSYEENIKIYELLRDKFGEPNYTYEYIWETDIYDKIILKDNIENPILAYLTINLFYGYNNIAFGIKAHRKRIVELLGLYDDINYDNYSKVVMVKSNNWNDIVAKTYSIINFTKSGLNGYPFRKKCKTIELMEDAIKKYVEQNKKN